MGKRLLQLVVALLSAIGLAAIVAAIWMVRGGIDARATPGRFETDTARWLRSRAIPQTAKARSNPLAPNEGVIREGMEHFADHCAVCHGNNGGGDTLFGRGMSPRPPDLRLEPTQKLSDGELFYIIENGVRLTGMPAFGDGTPESANGSWELVHFIRHLPRISAAELSAMEALNPRAPAESGRGRSTSTAKPHTHEHKR